VQRRRAEHNFLCPAKLRALVKKPGADHDVEILRAELCHHADRIRNKMLAVSIERDDLRHGWIGQGKIERGLETCALAQIDWVLNNVRTRGTSNGDGIVATAVVNADDVRERLENI